VKEQEKELVEIQDLQKLPNSIQEEYL
ncbi:MAG: hypothetical protein RLZZ115_3151, partial [Cyanobacteriota bacterium]